ncbi:hypothetical protein ACQJBY_030617 [Aegilops geniculata]|uniref:ORF48 n=1 Tax=Aegilops crassa TaxID=4481 RepID=Q9XPE1_AEGCR|nr:ORF48 [Aegilops crassa]
MVWYFFFQSRLCGCPLMFTLHAKSGFPWKNQRRRQDQSPFLSKVSEQS